MIFELMQDLYHALEIMPREHLKHRSLRLLSDAIRRDVDLIDRYPTTLFQCVWNAFSSNDSPGLRNWTESWRLAARENRDGQFWLRSLAPPTADSIGHVRFSGHPESIDHLAADDTMRHLFAVSRSGVITVWAMDTGRFLARAVCPPGPLVGAALSTEGDLVVVSQEGDVTKLDGWTLATRSHWRLPNVGRALAISPEARFVAFSDTSGRLSIGDASDRTVCSTRINLERGHPPIVMAGNVGAIGQQLFGLPCGDPIEALPLRSPHTCCVGIAADGSTIVVGFPLWESEIQAWLVSERRLAWRQSMDSQAERLAISPDGHLVVCQLLSEWHSEIDGEVAVCPLEALDSGGHRPLPEIPAVGITALTFSHGGNWLLVGTGSEVISVQRALLRRRLDKALALAGTIPSSTSVRYLGFSRDGRFCVSCDTSMNVRIFCTTTGRWFDLGWHDAFVAAEFDEMATRLRLVTLPRMRPEFSYWQFTGDEWHPRSFEDSASVAMWVRADHTTETSGWRLSISENPALCHAVTGEPVAWWTRSQEGAVSTGSRTYVALAQGAVVSILCLEQFGT